MGMMRMAPRLHCSRPATVTSVMDAATELVELVRSFGAFPRSAWLSLDMEEQRALAAFGALFFSHLKHCCTLLTVVSGAKSKQFRGEDAEEFADVLALLLKEREKYKC